jgi:prepilin-type processing-associated H-X9-DG protein
MWWLGGRNAARRSGGFTLVEILLIFAALAILAAILFPIFSQARRMGYQTKCAANLMQLGVAFNTYASDWGDRWPAPGGVAGNWSYWSQSQRTGNGDMQEIASGGIMGYIKQRGNRSVFCCPLMPDWKSYYSPRTYTMNSYLRDRIDVEYPSSSTLEKGCLTGIRPSRLSEPSRTILLFEGLPLTFAWEGDPYYVYIYRCCNWRGVKGYYSKVLHTIDPGSPWHGRFNNYLYADGHLRARTPGKYYPPDLSTHKEMYEWYVDKAYFERVWVTKGWYRNAPYE